MREEQLKAKQAREAKEREYQENKNKVDEAKRTTDELTAQIAAAEKAVQAEVDGNDDP